MKSYWMRRNVEYRLWLNEPCGRRLDSSPLTGVMWGNDRIRTLTLEILAHSGPLYYGLAGVDWLARHSATEFDVAIPSFRRDEVWSESLHAGHVGNDIIRLGLPDAYGEALKEGMLAADLERHRGLAGAFAISEAAYSEGGSSIGVFRALGRILVQILQTISEAPSLTETVLVAATPDFRDYLAG